MSARPPVTNLEGLSDVDLTSPADGETMSYDAGSSQWINGPSSSGNLSGLTDTDINTPLDEQVLKFDSASGKWMNEGPLGFSDIQGNIDVSQMNSGTGADTSTFFRGDGSWAPPPGAGSVPTTTYMLMGDGAGNATAATPLTCDVVNGLVAGGNLDGNYYLYWQNSNAGANTASSLILSNGTNTAAVKFTGNTSSGPNSMVIQNSAFGGPLYLITNGSGLFFSTDSGATARVVIGYGMSLASVADPGLGYINAPDTGGYCINGVPQAQVFCNGWGTAQTGFASDTSIIGSGVICPTGAWKPYGTYHCVFDLTKTAAGTGAIILRVRIGTSAGAGDAQILLFTLPVGTAAIDQGTFDVWVTFKTVGTSATITGSVRLCKQHATGGLATGSNVIFQALNSGAFNATTSLAISLSLNGQSAFAGTINNSHVEYKQHN